MSAFDAAFIWGFAGFILGAVFVMGLVALERSTRAKQP